MWTVPQVRRPTLVLYNGLFVLLLLLLLLPRHWQSLAPKRQTPRHRPMSRCQRLAPRLAAHARCQRLALSVTGPMSWWTMPSKGSQVARARNIDGEMVVSHEGPYKRHPRRTVAASKDHHVRMASPPLPPPEATQAMETHPIRAPREGL